MNPLPQIPYGPIHSFIALDYPLPEKIRNRLKQLSAAVHDSGGDGPQKTAAADALNDYLRQVRNVLGNEHIRREFLPRGS